MLLIWSIGFVIHVDSSEFRKWDRENDERVNSWSSWSKDSGKGRSSAMFVPKREEIVIHHEDDHRYDYLGMNVDRLLWILCGLLIISCGTNLYFCLKRKTNTLIKTKLYLNDEKSDFIQNV